MRKIFSVFGAVLTCYTIAMTHCQLAFGTAVMYDQFLHHTSNPQFVLWMAYLLSQSIPKSMALVCRDST
ncbi:hypothetical protein BDV97DRAFT_364632 [Delphinella strobiligena]|nr:hypothetical protein BDV97DRAFT_364632 [Delphinella strobiligena]